MATAALLAASGLVDADDTPSWLSDGSSGTDDGDTVTPHAPPGLRLHRRALSRTARAALATALAASLPDLARDDAAVNQAMVFAGSSEPLPPWAALAAAAVDTAHWPPSLTDRGHPPFNSTAINVYKPHDVLVPHVDLSHYADGVAIVSLGGPVVMSLTHLHDATRTCAVLLRPGDILTLHGDARWRWTHGFGAGDGVWRGARVPRARVRVGVTLRWMEREAGADA